MTATVAQVGDAQAIAPAALSAAPMLGRRRAAFVFVPLLVAQLAWIGFLSWLAISFIF